MEWLNYHHLQYFWVVAKEGSVRQASEILHLAQPTISSQIQKLERQVGGELFQRQGRGLKLTDLGRTVFRYADEIFTLGGELLDVAKGRPLGQPMTLTVGACDSLAKLVVHRLLLPALQLPEPIRLACKEGPFDTLLAELASFEIDLLLSDSPVSSTSRVKAFNHVLGECGITFFAEPKLARTLKPKFPRSLDDAPVLLPSARTPNRRALELWFDEQHLRPRIMGEFQDSALMKVFGQEGFGAFPVPSVIAAEVSTQYKVVPIGEIHQVRERFYAISVERRLKHPAVVEISKAAKAQMFNT